MKKQFIKFLPIAAAILLATSCSKDGDNGDSNVVNNPDPETTEVVNSDGTRVVPFSITVNTGKPLSKIAYHDTKDEETGKWSVIPSFEASDKGMEMRISSADNSVYGKLNLSDDYSSGIFSGNLTVTDKATAETALTGTITVPAKSGENSNWSHDGIEDLMGKCGHTYEANFKYGTKDMVELVDKANSYLEIFLEDKGGTFVDISGTNYMLNSDGMMWLMVEPDTKITSTALSIDEGKNRTTVAGKIHTIFRTLDTKKAFTGAEVYTLNEFQYGKFEARMKMAAASGTVSSMFLYQDGSEIADGRPWVEVDIEILGKSPNSFQSNIITGKAGAQVTSEKHHTVSPATDQTFHTYAIEWTPDYVRWTVDGVEVRKTEGGQVNNLTGTQGLRFNLWSSESVAWVGQFDESKIPLFQYINWVKFYKYTKEEGKDGVFTLDWTDDFDTFDDTRWGKANTTFDGNRVDLTNRNVYTKDGMLVLALTRKGREHLCGEIPQDNEQ